MPVIKGKKRLRRELEIALAAIRKSLEDAIERGEQFTMTQVREVLDNGESPLGGRSFVGGDRTITIVYGPGVGAHAG